MKKLIAMVLMVVVAIVSFGDQKTQVYENKAKERSRLLEEITNAKLEAGNNKVKQARIYYIYSSKLKKYGVELKKPDIGRGKGLNEKRTPKSCLGRGFSSGPARRRR